MQYLILDMKVILCCQFINLLLISKMHILTQFEQKYIYSYTIRWEYTYTCVDGSEITTKNQSNIVIDYNSLILIYRTFEYNYRN